MKAIDVGDMVVVLNSEHPDEPVLVVDVMSGPDGEYVTYLDPHPVCTCCVPEATTQVRYVKPAVRQ